MLLSTVPCSSRAELPIDSWRRCIEESSALEILSSAADRFGDRVAIVTSFQDSGTVLVDMAHRAGLDLRVITLDTGRLPPESYQQIERVRDRYGVDVELVLPDHREVERLVRPKGPDLFRSSPEDRRRCCEIRKVRPFRRAARGLDAWIAGVRREHSRERAAIRKVEIDLANREDGSLLKIHPLADWTSERIWSYLRDHDVPYHPLYDQGYHSIGCAPCTRPSRPGEPARASRWWWEDEVKECGLHLVHLDAPRGGRRASSSRGRAPAPQEAGGR